MQINRTPRPALAALAAVIVPVPLHIVGAHRHRADGHRVQHAAVVAKPKKTVTPVQPLRTPPRAPRLTASHTTGNGKPTLLFRVSSAGAGKARRATRHHRPLAHAAGDPAATISDYKFTPGSITIHVGDTITWTNNGPTDHTATANNGSFNTGTLKKGQSASHTFTQPGTIAYICTLHPFMHGTVVVVANATTTPASGGGSGSGTTPTATTAAASSPTTATTSANSLPNTGLDLASTLGVAMLLLGMGTALSRRSRASR